ncbi:hypothetical protein A5888_002754 [Enterococcus sp. 9E7_DIV0242]|uniref:Uncharacterized protein n=1 Tax=Candidatus Enterococcus clewellii TaxID=1834193 RepID=A0A242K8I4_9ENTE|nr:hypothetical protein A5888_001515 [Enterococcus sp. 9E7_DIV0242]
MDGNICLLLSDFIELIDCIYSIKKQPNRMMITLEKKNQELYNDFEHV